jgi:hypothetical protein
VTGVDWGSFLLVAIASIISACLVVSIYAVGLRLWSWGDTMAGKYSVADDGTIVPASQGIPIGTRTAGAVRGVRALAIVCFVVCALIVLYGVYLVIPQFHQ